MKVETFDWQILFHIQAYMYMYDIGQKNEYTDKNLNRYVYSVIPPSCIVTDTSIVSYNKRVTCEDSLERFGHSS